MERRWGIAIAGVLVALMSLLGAQAANAGTAGAKAKCSIKGTTGDDKLRGTKKRDVICARAGDDKIKARGGNDLIIGGEGDDVISGGPGGDEIRGEGDKDMLKGGAGEDAIDGGPSGDALYGQPDDDDLRGAGGRDTCDGGPGNDYCDGYPDFRFDCSRILQPGDAEFKACIQGGPSLLGLSLGSEFLYVAESPGQTEMFVQVVDRPESPYFEAKVTSAVAEIKSSDGATKTVELGSCGVQFTWIAKCSGIASFPQGSPTATWRFSKITIHDDQGHYSEYAGRDMFNPLGFDLPEWEQPTLDVVGELDSDPPVLEELTVSPAEVDTSGTARTIAVRARLTDPAAGFYESLRLDLHHPTNGTVLETWIERTSGTSKDAVYETTLSLPRHAAAGEYPLGLRIVDRAGNALDLDAAELAAAGLPSKVTQTGPGDADPPELAAFDISPRHSDGAVPLTFSLEVEDALSGVHTDVHNPFGDRIEVEIEQTSGPFSYSGSTSIANRVSGTANDGVWHVPMDVPGGREFVVTEVRITDAAGNRLELDTAGIQALGFDPAFSSDAP